MPSSTTYHLTWVSLTLGVGIALHGCSSKAQLLLLTLDEGKFSDHMLGAWEMCLNYDTGPSSFLAVLSWSVLSFSEPQLIQVQNKQQ